MTRRLGGKVDAAGYRFLADLHRPNLEQIQREAVKLLQQGLSARDVAVALRLHEDQVRAWGASCE